MKIRNLLSLMIGAALVKHEGQRPGQKDSPSLNDIKVSIAEELKARDSKLQEKLDAAEAQVKAAGKVSDELKAEIAKHVKESGELQTRLEAMEQEFVSLKQARQKATEQSQGIGEQFCASDEFKNFAQKGRGTAVMRLKAVTSVTSATTGTGAAGNILVPDHLPGIITPALRRLTIRDLLMPGRTSLQSIEFVLESGFQNMAAPVAEGAQKPQSDITFSKDTAHVRTIAHWLKASVQILADVPQLESYINARMTYGLKYVEETQLLSGDGTGENLYGLLPQATAFDGTLRQAGDTKIDTLRRAIYQVRRAYYQASGLVLNPQDWMDIELQKDANDRYLWVNVTTGGTAQLWRLPVVESDAIPAGHFLVGAFNMAAQVFDREDANVQVSTEDGDNFTKNMVTIRVEERLALVVYRPASFVYGPFIQAT